LAPFVQAGNIYLFQGEGPTLLPAIQNLIDHFALQEEVRVIVGANRISFDRLLLMLGEQAGSAYEILDRIQVSRAEICYQMFDVLTSLPIDPTPLVIIDMLESFYEEELTPDEVTLLLQNCLDRIYQLSQEAPILISARGDPSRPGLIRMLESYSDMRFYFESPLAEPEATQSSFPWAD
jgi:hypothetical protein